jgi:CBS domain-containing protein
MSFSSSSSTTTSTYPGEAEARGGSSLGGHQQLQKGEVGGEGKTMKEKIGGELFQQQTTTNVNLNGNPIALLMNSTTIKDCLALRSEPKPLLTLFSDEPISHALEKLGKYRVLGAPVQDTNRLIGFVEMMDIAVFAVASLPDPESSETLDIRKRAFFGRTIAETPIKDVMGLAGSNSMAVLENDPVSHAVQVFQRGIHRVAVYNEQKQVVSVMTQTDILRLIKHAIQSDVKDCGRFGERRLADFGYPLKDTRVFSINGDAKVISAIGKLAMTRVSALAVVNPQTGAIIGTFSSSDLRGLDDEQFPNLKRTVFQYLEMYSPASLKPIVETSNTQSLFHTIKTMLDNKVHRVWLVDKERNPCGVISMTDIMRLALPST